MNPTQEEMVANYQAGRQLARLFGIWDVENALDDIREADPDNYEEAREQLSGDTSLDTQWQLMYLTGLLPEQEFHEPFAAAEKRGEAVEFVDMPLQDAQGIYQCAPPCLTCCA